MAAGGAVAKLGGEQRRLSFSFPDGRCVWALSGRLEDPVDDHCVRVRLPVGKHRALLFPQGVHRLHPEAKKLLAQNAPKVLSSTAKMLLPGKK